MTAAGNGGRELLFQGKNGRIRRSKDLDHFAAQRRRLGAEAGSSVREKNTHRIRLAWVVDWMSEKVVCNVLVPDKNKTCGLKYMLLTGHEPQPHSGVTTNNAISLSDASRSKAPFCDLLPRPFRRCIKDGWSLYLVLSSTVTRTEWNLTQPECLPSCTLLSNPRYAAFPIAGPSPRWKTTSTFPPSPRSHSIQVSCLRMDWQCWPE